MTATPTDDEREALDYAIRCAIPADLDYRPLWKLIQAIQDSVLAAGFRRSEVPESSTEDRDEIRDEALWDFAGDLLDAWNIEDRNAPSLAEDFRDRFVARFHPAYRPEPRGEPSDARLPLDESEQCVACGSYACDCHTDPWIADQNVEDACRAFYEDARGLSSWERLTDSDPAQASDYRRSMRLALEAGASFDVAEWDRMLLRGMSSEAAIDAAIVAFASRDGAHADREDIRAAISAALRAAGGVR